MTSSCTPWEGSTSRSGHLVAVMRRRRSVSCSSATSNENGRMSMACSSRGVGRETVLSAGDDAAYLLHVAIRGLVGLCGGESAQPGAQVAGVPVPPVVRWRRCLEAAVVLGCLVQQLGEPVVIGGGRRRAAHSACIGGAHGCLPRLSTSAIVERGGWCRARDYPVSFPWRRMSAPGVGGGWADRSPSCRPRQAPGSLSFSAGPTAVSTGE